METPADEETSVSSPNVPLLTEIRNATPEQIQHAIRLAHANDGPRILASFLGKGSTEVSALRPGTGKYPEGQYPACREHEWYEVTAFFYEATYPLSPLIQPGETDQQRIARLLLTGTTQHCLTEANHWLTYYVEEEDATLEPITTAMELNARALALLQQ